MKRIIINGSELAISAGGYDVTTASGYQQLLFSTNFNALFGVFMSGTIPMGSFWQDSSWKTGQQNIYLYKYQLWFGVNLPSAPVAQVMFINGNFGGACPYFNYNDTTVTFSNGNTSSKGGSTIAYYTPYSDHIDFFIQYAASTYQTSGPTAISFVVGHS